MKKILKSIFALLLCGSIHAQNYVVNGDLELGTTPNNDGQLNNATGWSDMLGQCGISGANSPDLFDAYAGTVSPACHVSIPTNKWALNIPCHAGGHRYIGFSRPENAVASLNAFPANCFDYHLEFWVHSIDGWAGSYPNDCSPVTVPPPFVQSQVEVQLLNPNTCSAIPIFISGTIMPNSSWQLMSANFTLTSAQISGGFTKLLLSVIIPSGYTNSQIMFFDDFSITPLPLTPQITAPASFCSPGPISVTGSLTAGTSVNYYWEISESDQYGNLISGGYTWSQWAAGTPSTFTFPSAVPCGKYYRVKLAVQNNCISWSETTQVIRYNCSPGANAGPDVNICYGSCATIGTYIGPIRYTTFNWSGPGGFTSTGQQISVCPTTTSTYTLTVTNTQTGCSSSDQVTVNVEDVNSDFNLAPVLGANDPYYTACATPVVTNVSGIAGFGYAWFVEEIVSPTNQTVITTVSNPSCWWTPSMSTCFDGYDGYAYTLYNTGPMFSCGNPAQGHFTAGHTYRVTRGTWSTNCSWQQTSKIMYMSHTPNSNIIVQEDHSAPDFSYVMTGIKEQKAETVHVYPNPSTGIFNIGKQAGEKTSIVVMDVLGKTMASFEMESTATDMQINLEQFPKGIYYMKISNLSSSQVQKIIIQ